METDNDRRRYLLQALQHEWIIRAHLSRFTRDGAVIAELLQETWVRLLVAGRTNSRIKSPKAFALKVAGNLARDWLRRCKAVQIEPVEDVEQVCVLSDDASPERIVSGQQELERLIRAAVSMPSHRLEIFTLRKVYGLSTKEIASQLDIAPLDVEAGLRAAARWMIAALSEDEGGDKVEQGRVTKRVRTRVVATPT